MKQANASQINEEQAMFKITVIFDGIAVVNKTKLEPALQNCCLLEKAVLRIMLCECLMMPSKSVLCLIDIWSSD